MNANPIIVWFRNDLRLNDNPAVFQACSTDSPVIPVYIYAPDEEGDWRPGAASRWWLHYSLTALDGALRNRGSRLAIRSGPTLDVLGTLIAESGARAVFWNRRYEPSATARDEKAKQDLTANGIEAHTFNGALLFEPDDLRTGQGRPYQVFTPFWKACLSRTAPAAPTEPTREFHPPKAWPTSVQVDSLGLLPKIDWAKGIRAAWSPGEDGAMRAQEGFIVESLHHYEDSRNVPFTAGTSRLSPFLHFGELGPRQVWHRVNIETVHRDDHSLRRQAEAYQRQLGWREFAHHLLHHFPFTPNQPLRPEFNNFPWSDDPAPLKSWQRGLTGYPIVDAGMRELWTTGWMHNRVRMIAASFLVKHLLIPWQEGARWFWDTLVDADLANNTLGWQWVAGCGADAAPYFRIFNPTLQSGKFDRDGEYIRRWVPELSNLPSRWIHNPSGAPPLVLSEAGIKLGENYPVPIIEHDFARRRALAAYEIVKKKN